MYVILFESRLSDVSNEEYYITEEVMKKRVREIAGSDLISVKHYIGEDGERLAVVRWKNADTLEKWRLDPEHIDAKQRGRQEWYSKYDLTVAEVVRSSSGGTATDPTPLDLG